MSRYLLYDLEIVKAIPTGDRDWGIDYCQGWTDYESMGVSVAGFCFIHVDDGRYSVSTPEIVFGDKYGLAKLRDIATEMPVIGFNSRNFDDRLMSAQGFPITTDYDLLEEVRIAAYGSASHRSMPKGHSYKLGKIGEVNGYPKTGDGGNAAILWQQGQHQEVIDYCLNDAKITAELLIMGLNGVLTDPNTRNDLQLRYLP